MVGGGTGVAEGVGVGSGVTVKVGSGAGVGEAVAVKVGEGVEVGDRPELRGGAGVAGIVWVAVADKEGLTRAMGEAGPGRMNCQTASAAINITGTSHSQRFDQAVLLFSLAGAAKSW
jgi:hypothetical protein